MLDLFVLVHYVQWFGARQRRLLKRYAVIRKVAGSSPNEFTELFQFSSSFQLLYGAVITQPLTEMSTRRYIWG
jgi:hypothetical protein